MNRRQFLKQSALGIGGYLLSRTVSPSSARAAVANRPNIIWIIAEDFCPDLGCYGNTLVKTPHLDRLAAEGARYTHAYATAPVCSATRSAFMTGMYQTTIGAHQHRTPNRRPLPEPVRVITDYFRRAGYFTCNCSEAWTRRGKTDFNFLAENPYDGVNWTQRKKGQSFFAQINFSETHRTFKRDPDHPLDPDKVTLPPYYPDHPLVRRDWADYLETAQILDKKVGKILQRLADDGLADNTIVFFFGDHGRPHIRGKQFLYEGGIHVPLIIRWPGRLKPATVVDDLVSMIDFAPTCLKMVGIDPPAHLQGHVFWGPDAQKRKYIFAARDRCDETYDRIRCVRSHRYKYIRNFFPNLPYLNTNLYKQRQYPAWTLIKVLHARGELTPAQARFAAPFRPPEELYNLQNDPHEIHNLAEDPDHQSILKELRGVLDKWIVDTKDRGEISEDPQIAARVFVNRHLPGHRKTMQRRGLDPDCSPPQFLAWWEKQLLK